MADDANLDDTINMRVDSKAKKEFIKACKDNGKMYTWVLRDLMNDYVEKNLKIRRTK